MKNTLFFICIAIYFSVLTMPVFAQVMENETIKLELLPNINKDVNISKDLEIDKSISKTGQVHQIITGENYTITFPVVEKRKNIPMGLSVSANKLNFGSIKSGEPIMRTFKLRVLPGEQYGYSVFTAENHPLRGSETSTQIPNTSCDSGSCTATTGDLWNSPLTYGMGYTCKNIVGKSCIESFHENLYMRLPMLETNEPFFEFMQGTDDATSEIAIKVNIPATQPDEVYQNALYYILSAHY